MSPTGKKAVADEFERLLGQHNLDFRRVRAGLPHRTVYQRAVTADLTTLLLLHWHSYREQFCVEVGWLFRATFDDIGSYIDAATALNQDAVILGMWAVAGLPAEIWRVGRIASGDVSSAVSEAFPEVVHLGLPYLDRVTRSKQAAAGT